MTQPAIFRACDVPIGWYVIVPSEREAEAIRAQGLHPFHLRVSNFVARDCIYAFPPSYFGQGGPSGSPGNRTDP